MLRKLFLILCFALTSITTAWGVDYNLKVNGTVVTSSNASNLSVISGVSGTVRYDANTQTLYLEDATITGSVNGAIYSWSPLTINLSGANTVTTTGYYGFLLDDYCTITGNGSLCLTASSSGYDIELRQSDGVTITGGASVLLLGGGGIDNDGDWDETVTIDGANLYVRRGSPSTTSFFVKNVEMRNARLACPAWTNAAWEDGELSQGGQEWKGDICIMANAGNDVNGDGFVSLADVTKLVNQILGNGGGYIENQPDEIGEHQYVDLGLPSGTLWATRNIGAESVSDVGLYFAWGETIGYGGETFEASEMVADRYYFNRDNYKWYNAETGIWTKYITDANYGPVDNKTELEPMDDAAYVNWGKNWRMPTKEQMAELINTEYTNISFKSRNGINGIEITSKASGHPGFIFLPLTGVRSSDLLKYTTELAEYWTRSLIIDGGARVLEAGQLFYRYSTSQLRMSSRTRYEGLPIRPVRAQ